LSKSVIRPFVKRRFGRGCCNAFKTECWS